MPVKKIDTAVQIALISSIIGPVLVLLFKFVLEPQTIDKTKNELKNEISAITISDSLIRAKFDDSVVLVKNSQNKHCTGFLVAPSYIITSSNILKNENTDSLIIVRDINNPSGPISKKYQITFIDSLNKIVLINTKSKLSNAIELKDQQVDPMDKIFAIGFIIYKELSVVREGRIISNNYKPDYSEMNIYMGDIQIVPGMTGSPVFNKSAEFIGMVTYAYIDYGIAYIVPSRKIELLLEEE